MSQEKAESENPPIKRKSRLNRWLILAAFLAVLAGIVYIGGELLGPLAVSQIEAQTGMKAYAESAKFSPTGHLRLSNLKIMTDEEHPSLVLQARKVSARFSLLSILTGSPEMRSLKMSGGLLNAEYNTEKQMWNLSLLGAKRPQSGVSVKSLPWMKIADSSVLISRRDGEKSNPILSIPMTLSASSTFGGYTFQMQGTGGGRQTTADKKMKILDVKGTLSRNGEFQIAAAVNGLVLSDQRKDGDVRVGREMAEVLNEALVTLWDKYSPGGVVDVKMDMSGNLAEIRKGHITSTFIFKDVSICYSLFPYKLEHVRGAIVFEDGDLKINGLIGEHGETRVEINGYSRGTGPTWESDVRITSDRAVIDSDVYKALNTAQQRVWFMFSPSGTTKLDFHYQSSEGKEKLSRARLDVIDGEMMYQHFPHRFKGGTGTLIFEPDSVLIQDVNFSEGDVISKFVGQVTNIRSGEPNVIVNGTSRGLKIESKLLADYIKPAYRRQLADFDFSGRMDVDLSVYSSKEPEWRIDFTADVNYSAPELTCHSKKILLKDVRGRMAVTPGRIFLNRLEGTYGDGAVSLEGQIDLPEDGNMPACYKLAVEAENLSVDQGLLTFVPAQYQRLLEEIRPSGKVNISTAVDSCNDPSLDSIAIEFLGSGIELSKTGYRLSGITGKASMEGRTIHFDGLEAIVLDPGGGEPGRARLGGVMEFGKARLEELNINFDVEGLRFGKGLRTAAERVVPRLYDAMEPSGTVELRDNTIKVSTDPNGQRSMSFGGRIGLKGCSFGKEEFSDITATLDIKGNFEGQSVLGDVEAELNAEKIIIRDKVVSNLSGHVNYHKGQRTWSIGNFVGECYEGRVSGDVTIRPEEDGGFSYSVKGSFDKVNMGRFLAKRGADPNTVSSGTMRGVLMVQGRLGDRKSRSGNLVLKVAEMRIGRMSLMAKIFTLLSLSVPGDVAFHTMDMNSQINGERLVISDLRMSGDALNFKGAGVIDMNRRLVDIDLAATSPTPAPGLLTSVMTGLRYATVYLKVRGELDDPLVQITPLPMLDKAIEKVLGTRE